MKSMKKFGKEGVSEIIGTVLLLAIAIIVFSVLAIYVLSSTTPSTSAPHVNLVGSIDNGVIILHHQGGEEIDMDNIKIVVWKGEVDSCSCSFIDGNPSIQYVMVNDSNSNDRWEVGEYIEINASAIFGNITNWQISIVIIDEESNSIIMSGILQEGILHTVPPVAFFTYEPLNPKVGRGIIFNASRSYDPDGGYIVKYIWNFKDGDIETKYSPIAFHQYASPGIYNVTLTVIDDEGEQASITAGVGIGASIPPVNVTINQPPVAYFVNTTLGDGWVLFDASASYDPDGSVIKYIWDFGDGHTQIKLYDPTIKWQYAKGGKNYTVKLVVEDNDGATSSMVTSITLYGEPLYVPPIPPVVIIKTPADISTASAAFFSAVDSYDPDGDALVNFSWDFDGDGIADAYGINVTYRFYQPGNYTINLTVVDSSGGIGYASRTIYVREPIAARRFLIVDNTPVYSPYAPYSSYTKPYRYTNWDGISNILKCLNIGDVYDYGKAIDQDTFYYYHNETGWHNDTHDPSDPNYDPVVINDVIMAKYDIVIWSTGDYPGDGKWWGSGPKPSNPYLPNAWTTPMTEGYDDYANHMQELKNLMAKGGVFLLTGTYAVRDLQDYWGNWASDDEVAFGEELGLVEPTGGIDESLHTYDTIAYFADDAYNPDIHPYYNYFRYGPVYAEGVLYGIANTSSGGVNLTIEEPMPLYSIIKQDSDEFKYSLYSPAGQTFLEEDFSGSFPPAGWTQEQPNEWRKRDQNEAGGTAPEAELIYWKIQGSYAYLLSKPVNTTSASVLTLEFKSDIDVRYSSYSFSCYVYVRSDENDPWTDYTPWSNPVSELPPKTYRIDISDEIGPATQIKFEFVGSKYGIEDWSIDDVIITSSGIPAGYYAIDAVRGENRSVVLGFDLNHPAINDTDRERYIINVVNWLAEAVGYPTVIYVDNNKPDTWYDDFHVGSIQEAIDRIMVGGTIYVNGTTIPYTSFNVIKSVNIIGVDVGYGYPVIKANGEYAIKSGVDWVILKNLMIENLGNLEKGIYLDHSSSTSIINCTISGANYGIYAYSSNYLSIIDCQIHDNTYNIYMERCIKSEIKNNSIYSADYGIYAKNSPKLTIELNNIYENMNSVYLDTCDNSLVQQNSIYNNARGIYTVSSSSLYIYLNQICNNSKGICFEESANSQIMNNHIINNSGEGIEINNYSNGVSILFNLIKKNYNGIKVSNSNYLSIFNNNISESNSSNIALNKANNNWICRNRLISSSYGVHVTLSLTNNITNNTIRNVSYGLYGNTIMDTVIQCNVINDSQNAIVLENSHPSGGNNSIIFNTIYNCGYGIVLSSRSDNNIIKNNTISNVENWGIAVKSFSVLNIIEYNNISGTPYGIYIKDSSYTNISYNMISSPSVAIYLSSSDDNTLYNNSIIADYYGIWLSTGCNNNEIFNSTILNCLYGICLSYSYSTNVSYNLITNSSEGILFESADVATVYNNIIGSNEIGIHLISSENVKIISNIIYNNSYYGVHLENSKDSIAGNNEIKNNIIHDNGWSGIYLYSSDTNFISYNNIYNNTNGIVSNSSASNTIDSNSIYHNIEKALYLISSNGNRICNNSLFFNEIGMYFYQSSQGDQYKIKGNKIWNNAIGIFLNFSNSNYFGYDLINEIYNNTYGIYMFASTSNFFVHNIIYNNSYGIYMTDSSTNNEIYENNITTNDYGVYVASSDCTTNWFYWNNFINNTLHNDSQAYDRGNNSWYKATTGNYWSDHISTDPYTIPPGINQDKYPLLSPWQWWL